MSADFFPTICSSLHALTHLRLRDYGVVDVASHFAVLQQLTNLRNLYLRPSGFSTANQLVRLCMHTGPEYAHKREPHTERTCCTGGRTLTAKPQQELQPLAALTALESLGLCNYPSVNLNSLAKAVKCLTLLRVLNLCASVALCRRCHVLPPLTRSGALSDTPHRLLPALPPSLTALNLYDTKFPPQHLQLLAALKALRYLSIDVVKSCLCASQHAVSTSVTSAHAVLPAGPQVGAALAPLAPHLQVLEFRCEARFATESVRAVFPHYARVHPNRVLDYDLLALPPCCKE